jgi:hypothetical protein
LIAGGEAKKQPATKASGVMLLMELRKDDHL